MGAYKQPIAIKDLEQVLPYALPWLERTLEYNCFGYTLGELVDLIRRGNFQLWATAGDDYSGFVVTELVGDPPILNLFIGAGYNLEKWLSDLVFVENWARERGCVEIKVWGRKGWERKLKDWGYRFEAQVLNKRIRKVN
jgi:hypothetical protein